MGFLLTLSHLDTGILIMLTPITLSCPSHSHWSRPSSRRIPVLLSCLFVVGVVTKCISPGLLTGTWVLGCLYSPLEEGGFTAEENTHTSSLYVISPFPHYLFGFVPYAKLQASPGGDHHDGFWEALCSLGVLDPHEKPDDVFIWLVAEVSFPTSPSSHTPVFPIPKQLLRFVYLF